MEKIYTISLVLLSIITFILHHFFKRSSKAKLPPGPKPWPIIGNIHLLGSKPHLSVTELSKTYGPLMSLKLGSVTTIVISSPEVAKEMFLKHDLAFSSKHIADATRVANHDKLSIGLLPVCPQWRNLRKIMAIQLFTNHRLDLTQGLRMKKVDELVEYAKGHCERGLAMDIGKAVFTTSLNLLSNTLFSMDLSSYGSSVSGEFKELVWHLFEGFAKPNLSDFFPLVRPLDLQGVRRRQAAYFRKMLGFFERIIDERLGDETSSKDDVLGTLLKLVKQSELTLHDVKHMLIDLFLAGTDTSSNTLEWAMAELLHQPQKMIRAQSEIDRVMGKDCSRSIKEYDILKLPYIQAIMKETLRLHSPVPFLIPHKAETEVQLCGHHIPKGAQIWVNVWSIGRDPSVWPNSSLFMPERFLESEIDFKGQHFELIPFGAGRRMCPGIQMGQRMVHLMLANLLHSFDWKLDNGLNPEDIDMEEKFGLTLQKAQPLKAIPLPRWV